MAFIPATNCVRVVVEGLLDGQELANVYHVDVGATVTTVIMNAIIDEFETWLTDELLPNVSEDYEVTAITARDLTTITGALIERPQDPFLAGGQAAGALPNNVALCTTWFTSLAGRSYRGRTYVAGLDETNVTLSRILSGTAAAFATVMVELVNMIAAIGYDLVVASFYTALAPRVSAVLTPIIAAGVNTVMDSQRRRLPGRGN